MPLFIGIHGSSSCSFVNNGGCQLQLFFNNGGCQPLTFRKGCCICQWTVLSINGCCTLMATNPTPLMVEGSKAHSSGGRIEDALPFMVDDSKAHSKEGRIENALPLMVEGSKATRKEIRRGLEGAFKWR